MKLNLLAILACPACGGDLKFVELGAYPRHNEEVEEATLGCKLCALEYPVTGGVPRLRPPNPVARATAKTRDAFGWEWLRYPGSLPGDKETFLEETMLPPEGFSGKLVLDAGCGMGRYSAVALGLGAEVGEEEMLRAFSGMSFEKRLELSKKGQGLFDGIRTDKDRHIVIGQTSQSRLSCPPILHGLNRQHRKAQRTRTGSFQQLA